MPLTSTVETLSRPSHHAGLMARTTQARTTQAKTALAHATLKTRRDSSMPPKLTARFPRTARLLRHADFERVYKQGRRHFSASITVFYWPRPAQETPTSGPRIGFTVGRALGGAVQRNRIKRRLREAVRMSPPPAGVAADVVINPKKSLLTIEFAALQNEVSRAFAIIEQKLSGKSAPEPSQSRIVESRKPKSGSRP